MNHHVIRITRSKRLRYGQGCISGRRWFYEASLPSGVWVASGFNKGGVLRIAKWKRAELQADVPETSDVSWEIEENWN